MKMCDVENHKEKALEFVCINPKCKARKIFCQDCEENHPRECLSYIIKIQDILNRDLMATAKFIPGESINEAVRLIKKHDFSSTEQIHEVFEAHISEEFDKLSKHFERKVKEAKEKVMTNFNETYKNSNFSFETFKLELDILLEFESFITILDPLFHNQCGIAEANESIDSFFNRIHSQKAHIKNLAVMASQFVSLTEDILKPNPNPFFEAQESLSLKIFDEFPRVWSWDSSRKCSSLDLGENNLQVRKNTDSIFSYSVVYGSKLFYKGFHEWEIEVNTDYPGHSWGSFGIIGTDFVFPDYENFPYTAAMSLSTEGICQNMKQIKTLQEYDNKRYICALNMNTGEFKVSHNGEVIAVQTQKLEGKTFLPFVCLCYPGNMARIQVIRSIS